jgi:hypothetical protein
MKRIDELTEKFNEAYETWNNEKQNLLATIEKRSSELSLLTNENLSLKSRIELLESTKITLPKTPLLLICGDDEFCNSDRLQLNRARVWYRTLENATKQNVIDELNRRRENGDLYHWVHVAAHGSEKGIKLKDEIVSPDWFNYYFTDIKVVLFSNCESVYVGDYLAGVADYVIVFYGDRNTNSLERFTYSFWSELKRTGNVNLSYTKALDVVPEIRQYTDLRVK